MRYVVGCGLAGLGLLCSVVVHVLSIARIEAPLGDAIWLLHAGIFVVWVPLVLAATRTMPKGATGNLDHLLATFPPWVRHAVGALFVYTAVNFGWFIWQTRQYPKHHVPYVVVVHGFSGHWLLFYGVATMGFLALRRLERAKQPDLRD